MMTTHDTDAAIFTTPVALGTLTALDIKALRRADTLVFRTSGAESTIRCTKKMPTRRQDPFQTDEAVYTLYVEGTGGREACYAVQYANESPVLQTVWRHLKAGDVLIMRWHPDYYTNGYVKHAVGNGMILDNVHKTALVYNGLHGDILALEVQRRNKTRDTFLVAVSICPDNSARMIHARL